MSKEQFSDPREVGQVVSDLLKLGAGAEEIAWVYKQALRSGVIHSWWYGIRWKIGGSGDQAGVEGEGGGSETEVGAEAEGGSDTRPVQ